MASAPRLTIGMPVYNGQNYLSEAMDALLGQSYDDFELIISDNASTDRTAEICRRYEALDPRVRYFRQERNIGLAPNHNFLVDQARGTYFKWASHDDLYARNLLEECVNALDRHPEVVLVHSWTAMIDGSGTVVDASPYPLATSSPDVRERFRSVLLDVGGDDDGGVMRTEVLRRVARKDSYHHADRTIIAELALHGRFHQVHDWLYFRRDHPQRAERACRGVRARCANMDPRRADRLRHPVVRLYGEYVWAFIRAIHCAPIDPADRRACYREVLQWAVGRARPGGQPAVEATAPATVRLRADSVRLLVAGQGSKAS